MVEPAEFHRTITERALVERKDFGLEGNLQTATRSWCLLTPPTLYQAQGTSLVLVLPPSGLLAA
jgi:hypothetical protein